MRNPLTSVNPGLGFRLSACSQVAAGGPAGGAADCAAPASSGSPQASQAPGPSESFGDTGRSALPPATPCELSFHLHLERNRDATELFRAGPETWTTSVHSSGARTARLRTPGGSQSSLERACSAFQPCSQSLRGQVQQSSTASHPTLNPISDFKPQSKQAGSGPASQPAEAQATNTPVSVAATQVQSGKGIL